jgi:hypothetical protein
MNSNIKVKITKDRRMVAIFKMHRGDLELDMSSMTAGQAGDFLHDNAKTVSFYDEGTFLAGHVPASGKHYTTKDFIELVLHGSAK